MDSWKPASTRPALGVRAVGHTDKVGAVEYNLNLGIRRRAGPGSPDRPDHARGHRHVSANSLVADERRQHPTIVVVRPRPTGG